MTRISPGQHADNARTSWLILWTLISLCKCTLRSSSYSPFEILYGRPPPVIEKLKGNHQQLAGLEMSRHLWALEKSSAISPEKPQKGHPFLWTTGFSPISQEMRSGLKIRKKKTTTVQPVWTRPHAVILATPTADKVIGFIPWIHHTRVKEAAASCDEDTWKAVWTPETSSRSGSKDSGPHPRRTLSLL